jgi:branched-chain amino acid transport system permease protein
VIIVDLRTAVRQLLPLVALVALTGVVAAVSPASQAQTAVVALVQMTFVVGLYCFVGLTGVLSFGHMAFAAIGAYTYALLSLPASVKQLQLPDLPGPVGSLVLPGPLAVLAAGLVAALAAAATGPALMRLSGLSAGLATVSLLVIVRVVAQNWTAVTKGTSGISGVPTHTTVAAAVAWALGCLLVVYVLQTSAIGLRLRASREDPVSARSVGIDVVRVRWLAFTVSGFITGIGGALFAGALGLVTPDQFFFTATFLVIAMLVIGGRAALAGAVVGSLSVSLLAELLRRLERGVTIGDTVLAARPGVAEVVLALLLVLVLVVRPDGLTGGREFSPPHRRRGVTTSESQIREPVDAT